MYAVASSIWFSLQTQVTPSCWKNISCFLIPCSGHKLIIHQGMCYNSKPGILGCRILKWPMSVGSEAQRVACLCGIRKDAFLPLWRTLVNFIAFVWPSHFLQNSKQKLKISLDACYIMGACVHPHFCLYYVCVCVFTRIYSIFLCVLCAFLILPRSLEIDFVARLTSLSACSCLFRVCCCLGAFHELTHFILTITLWNRYWKTEVWVSYTQGHS